MLFGACAKKNEGGQEWIDGALGLRESRRSVQGKLVAPPCFNAAVVACAPHLVFDEPQFSGLRFVLCGEDGLGNETGPTFGEYLIESLQKPGRSKAIVETTPIKLTRSGVGMGTSQYETLG